MSGQPPLSGSSGDSSPGLLQEAMQTLEDELQGLLNPWAGAEEDLIRATAEIERIKAPLRVSWKREPPIPLAGKDKLTVDDLDALLLDHLWSHHEELMVRQLNAEALAAAYRTKERVASKALSSKQSRLKADVALGATSR